MFSTRSLNGRSVVRPGLEALEDRCVPTTAIAGDLDLTFGSAGITTLPFGAYSNAIQADGKTVVAGASGGHFTVARYNANGTLDTTFGGGPVSTRIGRSSAAWDVAIASDGKIIAAGYGGLSGSGSNSAMAVVRYNANGTVDKTFGNKGIATVDFTAGGDSAKALVLQPDGKIVIAGGAGDPCALARLNVNGTLDTTFGTGGKVVTEVNNPQKVDFFWDLALQPDGKIVGAGSDGPDGYGKMVLARYNPNGTLDASFGDAGIVRNPLGPFDFSSARAVLVQTDGKIVAAGFTQGAPDYFEQFAVVRLTGNGAPDPTFGTGGVALGGTDTYQAWDAILQPDGKIVAVGESTVTDSPSGQQSAYVVARFNTDGSWDSTFGTGGKVQTDIGPGREHLWGVALQTDGKIVACAGHLIRYEGASSLLAARAASHAGSISITAADAQFLLTEAIDRWQAAGVDTSGLGNVQIQVTNLGGRTLGLASGNDDSEFIRRGNQGEKRRMDLLTVLLHETGHLLGLEHEDSGAMRETLRAGVRWFPATGSLVLSDADLASILANEGAH